MAQEHTHKLNPKWSIWYEKQGRGQLAVVVDRNHCSGCDGVWCTLCGREAGEKERCPECPTN